MESGSGETALVAVGSQALARPPSVLELPPAQLVRAATEIANELKAIVEQQKLYTVIQGEKYVEVDGWTTMLILLGIAPQEEEVVELHDGSYEAKVGLYELRSGRKISSASALCGIEEKRWSKADRYARRSMAVTRATGKVSRLSFSWIMRLAGYKPTPLEEMPYQLLPGAKLDDGAAAPDGRGARQRRAAEPVQPQAPKRELFTGTDRQRKAVVEKLIAYGMEDRELQKAVLERMMGRGANEIQSVADMVTVGIVYDARNSTHEKIVATRLRLMQVNDEIYSMIHARLDGRKIGELERTIGEVESELIDGYVEGTQEPGSSEATTREVPKTEIDFPSGGTPQ